MWEYVYTDELYHHGIPGQRWGKRNGPPYPIQPGGHSAAEKRADSRLKAREDRQQEKLKKKKMKETVAAEKRKLADEKYAQKIQKYDRKIELKRKKAAVKNRGIMPEDELKQRIERLKLEKELRTLTTQEVNKGKNKADSTLRKIGKSALTAAGTTILTGAVLYAARAVAEKFGKGELAESMVTGGKSMATEVLTAKSGKNASSEKKDDKKDDKKDS